MNYYNEIEPFVAKWLTKLIKAGLISRGKVDGRSIRDVRPADIKANRTHFFAGIGGWDYALGLAGWPEDREVWTGSCPCQPFSLAGNRKGQADERHLWPEWFRLIRECRPSTIFGEQVGSAIGHGWLDLVFDDLEAEGYACGAVVLPACGVGAPHIRQRVWFVANSDSSRFDGPKISVLAGGSVKEVSDTPRAGGSVWSNAEWIGCDGKQRPTKPGLFPLANGIPSRVGRLRAYGNAIVPQLAAEFIRCAM